MSGRKKRFEKIRNNPKDVSFNDACNAAIALGFKFKGSSGGSHRAFSKTGEPVGLNFQDHKGKIPTYQARQLIEMMDKYEDEP